ncbi:MAG: hypothetical protein KY455_12390 [Euryarchaeota archaeon]|nr:hypothetical protein [Euryarchaeota archaeon]
MREVVGAVRQEPSGESVARPLLGRRSVSKARWPALLVPTAAAVVGLSNGLLLDPILWSGTAFITLGTGWLLPHVARRKDDAGRP